MKSTTVDKDGDENDCPMEEGASDPPDDCMFGGCDDNADEDASEVGDVGCIAEDFDDEEDFVSVEYSKEQLEEDTMLSLLVVDLMVLLIVYS